MQYQPPQDHQFHINFEELSASANVKDTGNKGFMVRGGPWEKKKQASGGGGNDGAQFPALDTSNAQDFPAFGGGPNSTVTGPPSFNGGSDGDNTVPPVTINGAWGPRKS